MSSNHCSCCGRFSDCCNCNIGPSLYYWGECPNCHPLSSVVGMEVWQEALNMLRDLCPQPIVEDFLMDHGAKLWWREHKET